MMMFQIVYSYRIDYSKKDIMQKTEEFKNE